MLKKVEENNGKYKYLHFSNIMSDSIGEGICYVRGGEHRFTRIGKPFSVKDMDLEKANDILRKKILKLMQNDQ